MTEAILQELERLESLTRPNNDLSPSPAKAKSKPIESSLDSFLAYLQQVRAVAEAGDADAATYQGLVKSLELQKREVDERLKEVHGSLTKIGKAVDKKFPNPVPVSPPLFTSPESIAALEKTIGSHFIRTGSFDIAEVFFAESTIDEPPEIKACFREMHTILGHLREGDIEPALRWTKANREFLDGRGSPLEFHLHRSHYMRLLLSPSSPGSTDPREAAIQYGRTHFSSLSQQHTVEIRRLTTSVLFLPIERMLCSPYADLVAPTIHSELEPMFVKEYCSSLGLSQHLPLRVACDIGGNGALARIEKGKKVMRDKKNEWSQLDELPIEIPLPPQHRYHSIFACPVSKEQGTDKNPPMMMACGHVVAKESLARLTKGGGRVKCPYCPMESTGAALQVHF